MQYRPCPIAFYRPTGLHESARLALKARKLLGGSGVKHPRKILKNRVSLMPSAFCSGFLYIDQVMSERKENIRNINKRKPKEENRPTLK